MSTINAADPTMALCAYLQGALGDLLAQNPDGSPAVYRPDLPKSADQSMPQACLVIRSAGGYKQYGRGQLPIGDPIIDIIAYGAVRLQSENIARAVVIALKALLHETWEHTVLYSAEIAGGPLPLPDQQTLWPGTLVSAQVLCGEHGTA